MKITTTLTAVAALGLIGAASPLQKTLSPLTGQEEASRADFDAAHWAGALGQADLKARLAAYEELVERAGRDQAAYEEVRKWAESGDDPELAWTAQLMLRELHADPFAGLRRGQPFRSPLGRTPFGPSGQDPFDFSELDQLLDDLRSRDPFGWRGGALPDLESLFGEDWKGQELSIESESFSLESGPDGLRVEIEEEVDGERQTKTYEAESLEALLEAQPELRDRIGARGFDHDGPRGRPWRPFESTGPRRPRGDAGLRSLRPLPPSLDRLGIQMLPPAERRFTYTGVPANLGLEVVAVLPGSLADRVGVLPGELVVSIAGEPIRSAADVQRVLAGLSLEQRIEVECVRPDGRRRVRSWGPKPVASEEKEEVL